MRSRLDEYPVAPRVAVAADRSWVGRPASVRALRVLPDGAADLIWDGRRLQVAGVATAAVQHFVTDPVVGLRLQVGAAGRVLGVPAHLVDAEGVELSSLWGSRAGPWERRLQDTPDAVGQRRLLGELVAERLHGGHEPDVLVRGAADLVAGGACVAEVAAQVALSPRALRRRFLDEVGLGPKSLHRVQRLRRFLALLDSVASGQLTLAAAATGTGYVDQAHLGRECRSIVGTTPGRLVARWARHEVPSPDLVAEAG